MASFLPFLLLALSSPASLAARTRVRDSGRSDSEGRAMASLSGGYPELCDAAIVAETCAILTEEDEATEDVTVDSIQKALASTENAVGSLWEALHLPPEATCQSLCTSLLELLGSHDFTLPPKSDLGCYEDDAGVTKCDLDLAPKQLGVGGHVDGDLPDFHAGEPLMRGGGHPDRTEEEEDLEIDYTVEELALKVANLFRVYPELDMSLDAGEDEGGSSLLQANSSAMRTWRSQVQRVNQRAEAYISTAVRQFLRKSTYSQITKWFGSSAYSNTRSRQKVSKVLNSIDLMLSKVDYVYPGPQCSSNTYAYVYPQAYTCGSHQLSSSACTKNDRGQFVFYMCQLTMNSPESVQIETLTHEGSHHATAYTDDVCTDSSNPCRQVAYGRSTCAYLARNNPTKALDNADNYCYYIQDVTDVR